MKLLIHSWTSTVQKELTIELVIISSGAVTKIFWYNYVDIIAANALATLSPGHQQQKHGIECTGSMDTCLL